MKPEESAECHQTLSSWVGSGEALAGIHVCDVICYISDSGIQSCSFHVLQRGTENMANVSHLYVIWLHANHLIVSFPDLCMHCTEDLGMS